MAQYKNKQTQKDSAKKDSAGNHNGGSKKKSFVLSLVPYVLAVVALLLMICFVTNLFCEIFLF